MRNFVYFNLFTIGNILCCVTCFTEECFWQIRDECNLSLYPEDYPDTVEELKKDCNAIKNVSICVLDVKERCGATRHGILALRSILDYVEKVCEESSPEFQVISSNLNCITPEAREVKEFCRSPGFSERTKELLIAEILKHRERAKYLTLETRECLDYIWRVSCPAFKIGVHCGDEVEKTILEVLEHTDYHLLNLCPPEVLAEAQHLKDFFQFAIKKESSVQNTTES